MPNRETFERDGDECSQCGNRDYRINIVYIGGTPYCTDCADEAEDRWTNHYFHCGQRWDDDWSCQCNDSCPVCHGEIEPYASTDNRDGSLVIHAQDVFDVARAIDPGC